MNGYCVIRKAENQRGDWKAMIAVLVPDLVASGRAVTSQDREMLRSWRYNYGALLRRSGNRWSQPAVTATKSSCESRNADSFADAKVHAPIASESAVGVVPKKKAKLAKEPSAGRVRSSALPERVSQRSSVPPDYFNPDGPPMEGDFSSANRALASEGRSRCMSVSGGLHAFVATSSHVDVGGDGFSRWWLCDTAVCADLAVRVAVLAGAMSHLRRLSLARSTESWILSKLSLGR